MKLTVFVLHCRPQALMLLCEFVLNSTGPAASEGALYLTLLQLYLAEDNLEDGDANAVPSVSPLARRSPPPPARVRTHTSPSP